jgi:cytochrome b561
MAWPDTIFKMWHVVHRPFSYAFLALLAIHIGMALWMGFV